MTTISVDAAVSLDSPLFSVDGLPLGILPASLCDSPTGLHVWLWMLSTDDDVSRWGDATWGNGRWEARPGGIARDVIADALTIRLRRGASSALTQPEAGDLALELRNPDGIYSPLAQLIDPAYVKLDSRIPAFVAWADPDGAVPLFNGYLDGLTDRWEPGQPDTGRPERDFVIGDGFDALALLAGAPNLVSGAPTEFAGDRIARLLDDVGWPDELRQLELGVAQVVDDPDSRGLLEAIQRVALSEGGRFFQAPDGTLEYQDSEYQDSAERALVPQIVLTDRTADPVSGLAAPVVCYDLAEAVTSAEAIVNRAEVGTDTIPPEVAQDSTSRATYGFRTLRLHDTLLSTDTECLNRANTLVDRYAYASRRIARVSVNLGRRGEARRAVCELRMGDRVRFVRHPTSGDLIDLELPVLALEHEVAAGPDGRDDWWAHIDCGPILTAGEVSRWGSALWNRGSWEA